MADVVVTVPGERDGLKAAPRRLAEAVAALLAAVSEAPGSEASVGWSIRLSER